MRGVVGKRLCGSRIMCGDHEAGFEFAGDGVALDNVRTRAFASCDKDQRS